MDGMTHTDTLSQCRVRHHQTCALSLENVACEVLFSKNEVFLSWSPFPVIHSWHRKIFPVTQLTDSMIMAKTICISKGKFLLRPSHIAALVNIHMDLARYDPAHCSSFHPSTLSIIAIVFSVLPIDEDFEGRI